MNRAYPLACQRLNRHWLLGICLLRIPPATLPEQKFRGHARGEPGLPLHVPK